MKAPLAVVTMTYNEAELLPVWRSHYAAQVGESACHVIDHGSDDGSTHDLGRINVLRIPRSPQDDDRRATAISLYCAALLQWYDAVIYVDVDELLVADPALFPDLVTFAACWPEPIATATGFDVIHVDTEETPIDWSRLVSLQRRWLRFSSAMCKCVLIRQPVVWAPGFHNANILPHFNAPLFLFHLRYADHDAGIRRLQRTRTQPWAYENAGAHQRMPDMEWSSMLGGMAGLPQNTDVSLTTDCGDLRHWRDRLLSSTRDRAADRYKLDLHLSGDALWALPGRFRGRF
ncbi:glycosyltransferase family 2 protein [Brytella acorum]|uniref:Glycosyltransferase family 2 protein n=1 Tax=Brytella acorum TaxID=2959299 RepID=A0AA35UTZ4_9PROT|nr:glycosyltransferase family 2 protein [Brytella acorum]MDF3624470.1 glycosyltransferase family 2 protein [Brytella acorum]CAI9119680.1 glycosyltransferase family 2 protein [Brytella acorum]